MNYMNRVEESDPKETEYAAIVVRSCKVGWFTGQFFPFEVGKVKYDQVSEYGTMIKVISDAIPKGLDFFIEKEVQDDLPNPCILDFYEKGEVYLAFIPLNPLPYEDYEFYEVEKNKWPFDEKPL